MKLTFYIRIKGHRMLKFDTAEALEQYVKSTPLPPRAVILLKNSTDNIVGEISVKKYLELEKSIK